MKAVKVLAVVATAGMFLVLVMGAAVTNTGSQRGCGPSWPLCRGQFIPQAALSTMIEFSHRAVVGIESVLIIALAGAALSLYSRDRRIRVLALTMVAFLFLQAGLGAWAVMAPQNASALALHFGVSLIAFVSVLLTTIVLFQRTATQSQPSSPVGRTFSRYVFATAGFSYVVVYLGAYVRHTKADDVCRGWPLCDGASLPPLHGLVLTNLIHRAAALLLTLTIVGLFVMARRLRYSRPDLYRGSILALVLVVMQALVGAAVVLTHVDLFSALAHAGLVALLFGSLTYLCLQVLPQSVAASESREAIPARAYAAVATAAGSSMAAPSQQAE